MWKVLLWLGCFLLPCTAYAWTALVEFTPPSEPDHMTVVLVSEVPGDYSQGYGQRSVPGATQVRISNIKPLTQYYFSAYQVNPDTWEKSGMSEEVPHMTEAYAEQTVIDLPPLPLGNIQVNITLIQEE